MTETLSARPRPIRLFETFYLASTLMAAVAFVLPAVFPDMEALRRSAGGAQVSYPLIAGMGVGFAIIFLLVLPLWLNMLVARRRTLWAYWVVLAIGAVSVLRLIIVLSSLATGSAATFWSYRLALPVTLLAALLHMIALGLLLTPTARKWLKTKPEVETIE